MARVAMTIGRLEAKTAEDVVSAHHLPQGIRSFTVEPGQDEDGDPVMWVWFNAKDPNLRDRERVARFVAFMNEVRDDIFAKLEEYRPHVGVRYDWTLRLLLSMPQMPEPLMRRHQALQRAPAILLGRHAAPS